MIFLNEYPTDPPNMVRIMLYNNILPVNFSKFRYSALISESFAPDNRTPRVSMFTL